MQKAIKKRDSRIPEIFRLKKSRPLSEKLFLTMALLSLGSITSHVCATGISSPGIKETEITQQRSVKITGIVKDAAGEPVIGASVMEKSTTNGTVTDLNGNFTLNTTSEEITLEISFVGYITVTAHARPNQPVNITLQEDSELLDEVVVVGYGTQKRTTMTAAVSSIKGDVIAELPTPRLSTGIGGK